MPFEDAEPKHRKGTKLNNNASSIPKPPPDQKAAFQEQANQVYSKFQEYSARGWELASNFKKLIEDTILPVNKTVINKDVEQEIINKLIALATEMNEDVDQKQGIGSNALCSLSLRMLLLQRDKINELSYRLENAEKRITGLQLKINEADKK